MSLHYTFPIIKTLDDIKPAIQDAPEFGIYQRDWGYVCDYNVNFKETFPPVTDDLAAIRRECRGIKFDLAGNLIARPYHKFFNAGEREGVLFSDIDLTKKHYILDKLDGSMIHPMIINDGNLRLATKMGVTDTSISAETFLSRHSNYVEFMHAMISENRTPIFEWCSRKNRIVIDYPVDRLVLTGIRDNYSGEYVDQTHMYWLSRRYLLDYNRYYHFNEAFANISALSNHTKDLENSEGYVVRFDDGHMVKLKADDYIVKHKSKENLNFEKNIIYMIANSLVDDVLPLMTDTDRADLEKFQNDVCFAVFSTAEYYYTLMQDIFEKNKSRKEIALESFYTDFEKSTIFKFYEKKDLTIGDISDYLFKYISKNCTSATKIDEIRFLWDGLKWDDRNYGSD